MTHWIDDIKNSIVSITTVLQDIPFKGEMWLHAQTMEDQLAEMAEVTISVTTAMGGYKISESALFDFSRPSTRAGPSGTEHIYLQRQVDCD
jgi:hypothetical protein